MYFADLTPYSYTLPLQLTDVLHVGWLDDLHDFPQGVTTFAVKSKLRQLMIAHRDMRRMRGIHPCTICGASHSYVGTGETLRTLGMSEIWIPSRSGLIYAAPSLILHYMDVHNYQPPREFLDAVDAFDVDADWDGEKVFEEKLRTAISPENR